MTAKPQKAPFAEVFTIGIPDVTPDNATVSLHWADLSVSFTVGTNTTAKAMASASEAVSAATATDFQTRQRAATFAYDSASYDQALKWADQSVGIKQTMSNLYLKARIQAKKGDKSGAIATAQSALKLATPKDNVLAGEIQESIDEWKK